MSVVAEVEPAAPVIWLWAEYRHKELVKLIPGARWDQERRQWRLPLSWAACKALRGVLGDQLAVGPNLAAWAQREVAERVGPCIELRSSTDAPGDPALYPYQRAGVKFLETAERCLLADEMGTGKTVQVAVALRELAESGQNPWPALVVCPSSVKTNWKRELEKWVPGIDVQVVSGSAAVRRKAIQNVVNVAIINYESTWRHSRLAPYGNVRLTEDEKTPKDLNEVEWRTVITDEAHRMKAPRAKQTRACWQVAHQASVRWRFALTGTPVANAPDDLWSLLHFCDPQEWPARTAFVERYCLVSWNPYGALQVIGIRPEVRDELYSVIDPRMRRMPKDVVLPFLPPKVRVVREAEMVPKQAKAYRQMEENMIAAVGDDDSGEHTAATVPLVQATRLLQFSSAYAQLDDDGNVRLTDPSNKVDALMEILEELGDEPVVVFAQSRQLIEIAAKRLEKEHMPFRMLVGGMTDVERDRSVTDFQAGKVRAILVTVGAGGEGITLARARHAVFLQRSWSMLQNKQAEDRVHRIGSEIHSSVEIIDLVAPGTIEERQIEALHEKFRRLQEIVRDRETLQAAAEGGDPAAQARLAQLEAEEESVTSADLLKEATDAG